MTEATKSVVKYNGRVGYLAVLDGGAVAFQYVVERLKDGFPLSPFHFRSTAKFFYRL